jgi:hypothetical protein
MCAGAGGRPSVLHFAAREPQEHVFQVGRAVQIAQIRALLEARVYRFRVADVQNSVSPLISVRSASGASSSRRAMGSGP